MSTRRQVLARENLFLGLRSYGLTFGEIAARMHVSRQRAHQIVRRAEWRGVVSDSESSIGDARGVVPRRKTKTKTKRPDGARRGK